MSPAEAWIRYSMQWDKLPRRGYMGDTIVTYDPSSWARRLRTTHMGAQPLWAWEDLRAIDGTGPRYPYVSVAVRIFPKAWGQRRAEQAWITISRQWRCVRNLATGARLFTYAGATWEHDDMQAWCTRIRKAFLNYANDYHRCSWPYVTERIHDTQWMETL